VHVLFATAELSPVARVGGLAAAAAGLAKALRELGVDLDIVMPDYGGHELAGQSIVELEVPEWAGPARARHGSLEGVGEITLIDVPGIARPHPYVQPDGSGWPDNDNRFFAFGAALAALVELREPDVLHLNDWHTASTLGHLATLPPTVTTIHTLGYQGRTNPGWLLTLPYHRGAFELDHDCNPLAGAIRLADRVIAVSPTYAREIVTPEGGAGLDGMLAARGEHLLGILNGIDTGEWDPATDRHIHRTFTASELTAKDDNRSALRAEMGLEERPGPLVAMVTRLVEQKGVDLVLPLVPYLARVPAQLAVLGDGDQHLAVALHAAAAAHPGELAFRRGYDEGLAHRLFAGADLFLMPSRFEPCGLAQMQAMRYGTLPVVTDVGGLHDTVIDVDEQPSTGTGIVAGEVSPTGVIDAIHRAARAHTNHARRRVMRRRGMAIDWSWRAPAQRHIDVYGEIVAEHAARRTDRQASSGASSTDG
jgi:starch synthase